MKKNLTIAYKDDNRRKKIFAVFLALAFCLLLLYYTLPTFYLSFDEIYFNHSRDETIHNDVTYLINTPTCKIHKWNPFSKEILKFIYTVPPIQCSNKTLLSFIEYNHSTARLKMNQSAASEYSYLPINCCYSVVTRIVKKDEPDNEVKFSECRPFEDIEIKDFIVKVSCSNIFGLKVYTNSHAVVLPQQQYKQLNGSLYSVLLVGIDSMSKSNFFRTMPKAYKFLESQDFVNLKGYTKIGDNTFPNLMAILTGKTWERVYEYCDLPKNKLNGCGLLWDRYRKFGYITGYAEDVSELGTFHYNRLGFDEPPTDFYFFPYTLASETLISYKLSLSFCSGPVGAGERILNSAKDFLINLNTIPKFGLFWMTSFSHDDINLPSAMNDRVARFLQDVYPHLNNTILIFFSDHGFRFGDIRLTRSGWYEERLPFIYIHFPVSFQKKYPKEFKNFVTNSDRLTNPFDLYMTLQTILHMGNESYKVEQSEACPGCHSLFEEVDENRTCTSAAIEQHWCLCTEYFEIDVNKKAVQDAAKFMISEVNQLIKNHEEGNKCANYSLGRVISANISASNFNEEDVKVKYLVVHLETEPSARFEATLTVDPVNFNKFKVLGDFSRTDRYAEHSTCAHSSLKKYCYCEKDASFR